MHLKLTRYHVSIICQSNWKGERAPQVLSPGCEPGRLTPRRTSSFIPVAQSAHAGARVWEGGGQTNEWATMSVASAMMRKSPGSQGTTASKYFLHPSWGRGRQGQGYPRRISGQKHSAVSRKGQIGCKWVKAVPHSARGLSTPAAKEAEKRSLDAGVHHYWERPGERRVRCI